MSLPEPASPTTTRTPLWLRRALPLIVLAGAVAAWFALVRTPPQTKPKPSERPATLVEVETVEPQDEVVKIEALGTVRPAQQIELLPRVGGEVLSVSDDFAPGGLFEKGATLLTIDPLDYELAKRAAEKTVAEARMAQRVEEGAQTVAKEDYELLGDVVTEKDRDLVLRQPQLAMARATLEAAEAGLERAETDLARTKVVAPFNAIVQGRPVNAGARVSPTTPLATLIGTDAYWIEATLPVSQLQWIEVPGAQATIRDEAAWGVKKSRTGRVRGLAAGLEEQGRLAQLIVEVSDPLGLADPSQPRMLIGSLVRVEFTGRELENVMRLPQDLVHEGDHVWVLAPDGTLDIREVEVALRERDHVVVTGGLQAGERIVTTNLPAPVQGMALRTEP